MADWLAGVVRVLTSEDDEGEIGGAVKGLVVGSTDGVCELGSCACLLA